MIVEKRLRDARQVKMTCYHLSDEKNSINSQYAFCTQSAFCILYLVCILRPVCSLQSVFCSDRIGIAVFVRASLKSGPKYWSSKNILVRLSWPLWLICGLYVEELTRDSTIIEQWLLISTEDGRKCAAYQYGYLWYTFAWSQRVSKWTRYGSLRCENIGFSIQVAFSEVLEMWFEVIIFIKPYKHFISFHVSFWASSKLIWTFTKSGGVAQISLGGS